MTGKRDEAGAVQDWVDEVFQLLKQQTDQLVAVVVAADKPITPADAEKRARTIGVLARTAKAVAALKTSPRKARDPEEDEMREDDDEPVDEAEEQRMRADLRSRADYLLDLSEQKGFGPSGAGRPFTGGTETRDAGLAEVERRPVLAG